MAHIVRGEEPVALPMEASVVSVSAAHPKTVWRGRCDFQIDLEPIAPLLTEPGRAMFRVTLVLEQPAGPADVRHFEIAKPPEPRSTSGPIVSASMEKSFRTSPCGSTSREPSPLREPWLR